MNKLFPMITSIKGTDLELRRLIAHDADGLRELTESDEVYTYLPTFLFEKKYDDPAYAISRMYDECIKDSLILGIFSKDGFCGLAELYGWRGPFLKVSVGYRLLPRFWGKGIATEALGLLVDYLFSETKVRIVTASVIPENAASAGVLKKNGFHLTLRSAPENWGHALPTLADKWLKTASGGYGYQFHKD